MIIVKIIKIVHNILVSIGAIQLLYENYYWI